MFVIPSGAEISSRFENCSDEDDEHSREQMRNKEGWITIVVQWTPQVKFFKITADK